mmetsp:Transcript_37786/g.100532  ORF Transcript_37786/g.100532 Transcript_37786/m.100532 type:complete len:1131 (-) Transcript_37786:223-3615(-)
MRVLGGLCVALVEAFSSPCMVPPLPHAGPESTSEVPELGFMEWICERGFTTDGSVNGPESVRLQCLKGAFVGFGQSGCLAVVADNELPRDDVRFSRPRCAFENDDPGLDVTKCHGKRESESCTVRCKPGFYQPTSNRYATPLDPSTQTPVLLVCSGGRFLGTLPTCTQHREHVLEFDVYAALKKDEDEHLMYPSGGVIPVRPGKGSQPENINVFDLEGLLSHLYTDVFFFQRELAVIPGLFLNVTSGRWYKMDKPGERPRPTIAPHFPVFRDAVDTLVWYRIKVKNPLSEDFPIERKAHFEFASFASFADGKAPNEETIDVYKSYGAFVGLEQQQDGENHVFQARDPDSGDVCDMEWKHDDPVEWAQRCRQISTPRGDPRYNRTGRMIKMSLPGRCANLGWKQKTRPRTTEDNRNCLVSSQTGEVLSGGLCPPGMDEPDGTPECTYVIQEIAQIAIDEITGVREASCADGKCRSLRDFELNCVGDEFRVGVKYHDLHDIASATNARGIVDWERVKPKRQCVEYAPAAEEHVFPDFTCDGTHVESGSVWQCSSACRNQEVSLDRLRWRCDAASNVERLNRLQRAFQEAVHQAETPAPVPVFQDCDQHLECQPLGDNTERGLNYCERDTSGICTPCHIPGTILFDPNRVLNVPRCRLDLISSGAYTIEDGVYLPDCDDTRTADRASCCNYLGICPRTWIIGEAGACDAGSCGPGSVLREAKCERESEFGDCRRDLGDPVPDGFCSSGVCFVVEKCLGKGCPWAPYCEDGFSPGCLPSWGVADSDCASGVVSRYRRCTYFLPTSPDGGAEYCAESLPLPVTEQPSLVLRKSRFGNCLECDAECRKCAGPFELIDGSCQSSSGVLELTLEIQLPVALTPDFVFTPFQVIENLMKLAAQRSRAWDHNLVFLIDVFRSKEAPHASSLGLLTSRVLAEVHGRPRMRPVRRRKKVATTTSAMREPTTAVSTTSSGTWHQHQVSTDAPFWPSPTTPMPPDDFQMWNLVLAFQLSERQGARNFSKELGNAAVELTREFEILLDEKFSIKRDGWTSAATTNQLFCPPTETCPAPCLRPFWSLCPVPPQPRNYASLAVVVLISLSLIGGTLGIVYLFYNKMFCFDEGSSQTAAVELTPQRGV